MSRSRRTLLVQLPELSPREAVAVSYFLDQLDLALWAINGDKMTRLCEREGIPRIFNDKQFEQKTAKKRRH